VAQARPCTRFAPGFQLRLVALGCARFARISAATPRAAQSVFVLRPSTITLALSLFASF
jgi:hypothetical protein